MTSFGVDVMPTYRMCYFNGRGLAETSRLLFAIADVDYTDYRYPLEILDWKTYNFVREEFDADKANNKLVKSLNKVPFLEIDGEVLCQSKAIERYLARRFKMMGDDEVQAARIDSICECVRDFKTEYQTVRKLPEDERELGMKKWFEETLPARLASLEHLVEEGGYAVGSKLSLADVVLFSFLTQFFDNKEGSRSAFETTTNIRSVVETVEKMESVQNWLSSRPETAF